MVESWQAIADQERIVVVSPESALPTGWNLPDDGPLQRYVSFSPFDAADVGRMQVGQLAELLLGPPHSGAVVIWGRTTVTG